MIEATAASAPRRRTFCATAFLDKYQHCSACGSRLTESVALAGFDGRTGRPLVKRLFDCPVDTAHPGLYTEGIEVAA